MKICLQFGGDITSNFSQFWPVRMKRNLDLSPTDSLRRAGNAALPSRWLLMGSTPLRLGVVILIRQHETNGNRFAGSKTARENRSSSSQRRTISKIF